MRLFTSIVVALIFATPVAAFAQNVENLNQIASSTQSNKYFGVLMGDGAGTHKATASSSPTIGYIFATSTRASFFNYASSTALTAGNLFATNLTLTNALTVPNGGTGQQSLTGGNVVYGNGTGPVGTVATGTVSAGSSAITVTANRFVLGGALAIDCAAASGSQNGCLSSGDWTIFNSKSGFAFPFTTNAATLFFNAISNSTTTQIHLAGTPVSLSASSTSQFDTSTTTAATIKTLYLPNQTSALLLTGAAPGLVGSYGGASACGANNFVTTISAVGGTTCGTASISGVSLGGTLAALTALNTTLTFSGSYTGTAAQTVTINLGNADTWTALHQFQANASTTLLSSYGPSYFGRTSTTTIANDGSITTPAQAHNAFTNSSTTNETVSGYLEIPHSSNPAPVVSGQVTHSTNAPYQIHIGNAAAGTTVFDPRPAFTLTVASSTLLLATTTGPGIVIPFGVTVTNFMCTVQPAGATAEIAWQYANPSTYASVITYLAASSTPGNIAISSSNTPTAQATSTLAVGNTTGSATSASCTFYGNMGSI